MKTKLLFMLLFFLFSFPSYALHNKEEKKISLAFEIGYGYLTKGTGGLTKSTDKYIDKLTSGITWNSEVYFRPIPIIGLGLLYTGYTSKASHSEGSDHIYTHYVAPQIGFTLIELEKWSFRIQGGGGLMNYYNNSKVFGKPRKVHGNNIAGNIGGVVDHKISDLLGVSLRCSYIGGKLSKTTTYYHNEKITVKPKYENGISLSGINVALGMMLYF